MRDDQTLLPISQIALLLDIHPQTLRLYERAGFITPTRTRGNTRLYSRQDIERLRTILHLTRDRGVNLAGVDIILNMQRKLQALQGDIDRIRQTIAAYMQQTYEAGVSPSRALVKATPRKLVKVP